MMAGPRITARSNAIDVISVIPTTTPEEEEAEGDVLPSILLGRRKRTTKKRREKRLGPDSDRIVDGPVTGTRAERTGSACFSSPPARRESWGSLRLQYHRESEGREVRLRLTATGRQLIYSLRSASRRSPVLGALTRQTGELRKPATPTQLPITLGEGVGRDPLSCPFGKHPRPVPNRWERAGDYHGSQESPEVYCTHSRGPLNQDQRKTLGGILMGASHT